MTADDPAPLLLRYSRHGDEEAFRELVHRHAGLVYAAVQRRLGNRSDQAADVAQAVFVKLAQRARVLPADVVLPVWLHSTAVRLASNHLRSETRRAFREQTSLAMNDPVNTPPEWQSVAPELDEALLSLKVKDRHALLLRYFEGRDVAGTGKALGISADAAQKRIARALDRLRSLLVRRGVKVSAGALALYMGTPAARAAPAGFAGRAATAGLATKPLPWHGVLFRTAPWSGAAGAAAALAVFVFFPVPAGKEKPVAAVPTQPTRVPGVPADNSPAVSSAAFAGVRALLGESLTPQQIIAELDRLSRMPRTTANRLRVAAVLEKITATNAARVAALCDETLTLPGQLFAVQPVLLQWRRFDPAATLEFAIARRVDQRFNGSGMGIVYYLVREWAGQDLEQASAWVVKNLNNRPGEWRCLTVAADVLDKLCAKSPEEGADFVIRLPEGEMKKRLVEALAGAQVSELRFRAGWESAKWAALAGVVAGRGEALPPDCLPALISHWAESDPAAAREWVESLPDGPQKLRAATGYAGAQRVIVDTSAETGGFSRRHDPVRDRPERAAWILSLTNEDARGPALQHIAQSWHDDKAREWIMAKSSGVERDHALRIMAGKELENKESALKHAAAISNESLKQDVIAGLYVNWHQNDAKAAEEWLAAANLPETVKSRLEALTP